ncbi:MAG: 5'-deoxyadenosine deaminase [Methanonatronarchaeales archaeon]|nr:5'-deoxyadenosine deaminase [Methanonatronarchaeales archaeon]
MILRADHVLPVTSPPVEDGGVLVRDGLIQEVGPFEEVKGSGEEVHRFEGSALIPGLVNAHCHSGMTLLRGYADDVSLNSWLRDYVWPVESRMNEEDVGAGASLACAEMLLGGVTGFADMYFHMGAIAAAVEESGMRALLSYGMIDVGKDENGAEAELEEGRRFAEEYGGAAEGRIETALGPHSPETCSARMYPRDSRIMTHVSETESGVTSVVEREGQGPVEFLDGIGVLDGALLAHGVHLSGEEMEILAERGAHVAHCPSSNLKLGSGVAPVRELLEVGVNVCLGTDGAASNNNLDMFHETRLAALLHKGVAEDATTVPAETALEMATLNGAEALGVDAGALEPGKHADIVAVDLSTPHDTPVDDPVSALVYSAKSGDVTDVFVAGEHVVRDGDLRSLDLERVVETAERSAERLRG